MPSRTWFSALSIAAWRAALSSACPSPRAPNSAAERVTALGSSGRVVITDEANAAEDAAANSVASKQHFLSRSMAGTRGIARGGDGRKQSAAAAGSDVLIDQNRVSVGIDHNKTAGARGLLVRF